MRIHSPIALGILLTACAAEPPAKVAAPAAQAVSVAPENASAEAPSLTRVEPSLVCMVNNQFMGKPQIPVVVSDKTYFGCCEMCKTRLADDPESRAARDPVSGARVDKAGAVIGKDSTGAVHYFESEANLKRYASR